jgi:hypothetical protein
MVLLLGLFIFFPGKESEPKETARAPLNPARRRGGWRTRKLTRLRRVQTVRALIPATPSMLSAGQREKPANQINCPTRKRKF